MARGPETTFIRSVHRFLPAGAYHMKNNNMYVSGIADVWYDGPSADLWIEYKFIVVPKNLSTTIDLCSGKDPTLSKPQQEWLSDRHANGRNVAVIVGCKDGGVWLHSPAEWKTPMTAAKFRQMIVSRSVLAGRVCRVVYGQ